MERLRQTGREQSDSNKVNLPPIHLPQHVSRLTGRALHTLTNAMLRMRAQTGVPHTAFGCYTPPHKWTRTFSWPPIVGFTPVHSSIIHQQRWLSERSTLPHLFLWLLNHIVYQTHLAWNNCYRRFNNRSNMVVAFAVGQKHMTFPKCNASFQYRSLAITMWWFSGVLVHIALLFSNESDEQWATVNSSV